MLKWATFQSQDKTKARHQNQYKWKWVPKKKDMASLIVHNSAKETLQQDEEEHLTQLSGENKQKCFDFLDQLPGYIQQAEQEAKGDPSPTTTTSQYTEFEKMLLEYKEGQEFSKKMNQDIKNLVKAMKNRDRGIINRKTSVSRVLCNNCDQHYWSQSSLVNKKHHPLCQLAQKIRAKLLKYQKSETPQSPSQDDALGNLNHPEFSNIQDGKSVGTALFIDSSQGTNTQMQTPGFLNSDLERHTLCFQEVNSKSHKSNAGKTVQSALTIESSQETQNNWEESVDQDFIIFHKGINKSVHLAIQHFQQLNLNTLFLYCNSNGVYGSLVEAVGKLIQSICEQPLHKSMYYYSFGIAGIGSFDIRFQMFQILIAGIRFEKRDETSQKLLQYSNGEDKYLTDEHIEAIRYMIQGQRIVTQKMYPLRKKNTLIVNSFFVELLEENQETAFNCLVSLMKASHIYDDTRFLVEELLIPINVGNNHWILGLICFRDQTYYVLDPFCPSSPTEHKLEIVQRVILEVKKMFTNLLPENLIFTASAPKNVKYLPIQRDGYNCGTYISIYMLIYSIQQPNEPFIGRFLPDSIDECRFLMLTWILRGEIFLLDQLCK
jgi:hypothetical protein